MAYARLGSEYANADKARPTLARETKPLENDIAPENISRHEQLENLLIDMTIESWRLSRIFTRIVDKLDAGETGRYVNQLRYFLKRVDESLDTAGFKLVNVEGQLFDPGMAASALNIGEFGPDDILLVEQMIEPIIMGPDGLKKQGTVILRKVEL